MRSATNKSDSSLFFALFTVLFLVIFNYTLTLMGGIYIMGSLGGGNDIVTYSITFFSLGNALGIPLGKPLGEKIGEAKLLFGCLLCFAFFSFCCSSATNYPQFLFFRFMHGFVAGPLYGLARSVIFYYVSPERKSTFTIIFLTIITVGPVIGASWGGTISYEFNWRYIFYFNMPIILFLAFFLRKKLKGHDYFTLSPIKKSFDYVGYFFYFISIFCLGCFVILGQQLDWFRSSFITTLFVLGSICLVFFIIWDLKFPNPILRLDLFKTPIFSFALFMLAALFSAYFGMVILIALWLNLYADYTPIWVGVLLGNMAFAGIVPTVLIGNKFGKSDCRIPLAIGIIFFAISCFHTMRFNVEVNFGRIAFSRILAGFGLAFFLPPIFRLCFRSFSEDRGGDITNLFQIVRALSSGLGAAVYTTLWLRREVVYHDRLGSMLTPFSEQTEEFFIQAKKSSLEGEFALAKLADLLQRQAISLGLDDCFYLLGLIMVGLLLILGLTLLVKKEIFYPEISQLID